MLEKELAETIGLNIADLLVSRNMKQVDLSRMLKVSESTVGKWILGKSIPKMGTLEQIAQFFNVTKSDLLNEFGVFHNYQSTSKPLDLMENSAVYDSITSSEYEIVKLWRESSVEGQEAAKIVLQAHKKTNLKNYVI